MTPTRPVSPVTVLGGHGFIGARLRQRLDQLGVAAWVPGRDDDLGGKDLGCVVYCAGVTADFRTRLLDTVDAHVSGLVRVLRTATIGSLVYLSSTRVYRRGPSPAHEESHLLCDPTSVSDLYDISKMLGEAVALTRRAQIRVHVLRLSNVYGHDAQSPNFLTSIMREALQRGEIVLRTAPASAKDYVSVDDVVGAILDVAAHGTCPVYNVASGRNTTHLELVTRIASMTGCQVRTLQGAPEVVEPEISIRRLREEFGFSPANVLDDLGDLVGALAASPGVGSNAP